MKHYSNKRDWIRMSFGLAIVVVVFAVLSYAGRAHAVNYALCESLSTGQQAVFENSCPSGWVFVRYV